MSTLNKTIDFDPYLSILANLFKKCEGSENSYQDFCRSIRRSNANSKIKIQKLRLLISAFEDA